MIVNVSHSQSVVVVLNEIIRLMGEIEEAIDALLPSILDRAFKGPS